MWKKVLTLFISLGVTFLTVSILGCNFFSQYSQEIQLLQSSKPRDLSPQVDQGELAQVVGGLTQFSINLYQTIHHEPGNLFFSPYSIYMALAMAYAGAKGETERQMERALSLTLSQERLHPAINALDLELTRRGQEVTEGGRPFRLNVANALWGQIGHPFIPEFLDVLAVNYGAGLRLLDFASAPEASRLAINEWVSKQTEGKIRDLLPPGSISPETLLVLTNAIYFSAAWHYPFNKDLTRNGWFNLLDGSRVTVPMMTQTEFLNYAEGDGYQAVELPYRGRDENSVDFSMVIFVPELGRFQEFERSLSAQRVKEILDSLRPRRVRLTMPKFTYDSSFSLKEGLAAMGMLDAFVPGVADFSGMDGTRELFIGDVVHKAFVSVDEAGTEAAAATAVLLLGAAPGTPAELRIDRPFIFLIRDIKTGAILFMGRVVNPQT